MPKAFKPKVVTANDLLEGDVIYLTAAGDWTRDLSQAAIANDNEAANALLAKGEAQQSMIVGAYLADVATDDETPRATHYREDMRTRGPSVRPDLGKQAEA